MKVKRHFPTGTSRHTVAAFCTAMMCCAAPTVSAHTEEALTTADTTRVVDIEAITVVASPKEHTALKMQPIAATLFDRAQLETHHAHSIKGVTALTPNLFIPDYGSSLTSAIYIRGIGSRTNTPAVGLYVDNIPYIEKSAFDFSFADIERIDVLRGPQGTLYGRNTMGGLIRVYTRNPFRHPGTEVNLGAATGDNSARLSITHRARLSDKLALSIGGHAREARGFFRNETTGRWADPKRTAGGNLRAVWLPAEEWKIDFNAAYDYTDEGGYAYRYTGATDPAAETYLEEKGRITAGSENSYWRSLLTTGLSAEWQAKEFTLTSTTGYQHVNDRMTIDQDFLAADIYTLSQRQKIHTLSEELTAKSKPGRKWQWTTGLFGFHQWTETSAPVTFRTDGMAMLNRMLAGVIPSKIEVDMGPAMSMNILPSLAIESTEMPIDGRFSTPQYNLALFHQSSFRAGRFTFTAGLRLEYERMELDYNSGTSLPYSVGIKGEMVMGGQTVREIDMMPQTPLTAASRYAGSLSKDYVQLLPKVAVQYALPALDGHLYAGVSKGYRSGGYNIQMFSDLLQSRLRSDMMGQSKEAILGYLQQMPSGGGMPDVSEFVEKNFPDAPEAPDARKAVEYDPEEAWSYEAGTHLQFLNGKLVADAAFFLTHTRNQQIARFAAGGLGRETVNAGRSRSYGAELSLKARPHEQVNLYLNYGYTHATFRQWDEGTESNETAADYCGNHIPYVPSHTLSAGGSYTLPTPRLGVLESVTFRAGCTAAGRIYWTEQNNTWQDLYALLDGGVTLKFPALEVDVWGRNLTATRYDTFYFESMSRGFAQEGAPRRFGIDLRMKF